ncbi:MAG: helix-turn-helix domain-containing protein [Burkholderiales bacterium]|jgi:Fis family transcriptional regulator|nr:Fis family transcriptional regulator [Pseudomonadota bacterium]MDA1011067.1 Fis family transcriptional regulator [Pseudomonadota bacterium]|tara:strand:+ start:277 stop:513 length:237 start_codon:yes stop_codon:yes gene_type:complete
MSKQSDLANAVKHAIETYFKDLEGEKAHGIYSMVIDSVEKTLIGDILKRSNGNQSEAAQKLGINRNTLRAKMKKFNFL